MRFTIIDLQNVNELINFLIYLHKNQTTNSAIGPGEC